MGVTRKQLQNFGASAYLAKRLTKPLQPVGRQGRAFNYDTSQVLEEIQRLLDAPKIRKTTKATLEQLEIKVSGAVEAVPADDPLLEAMQRMSEANARFEQTARHARKVAEDYATYKVERGSKLQFGNNVVPFAGRTR